MGGKNDDTNIGATWLYKTSINAKVTFKISGFGIFDNEEFQRIVQRNIEEYLASIPRNDTVNGTQASLANVQRRGQECSSGPFEFVVGPQGFNEEELVAILRLASKQQLFKGFEDDICDFVVEKVAITIPTSAPTLLPNALMRLKRGAA